MVTSDTDEASKMKADSKTDFEKVMNLETDSVRQPPPPSLAPLQMRLGLPA